MKVEANPGQSISYNPVQVHMRVFPALEVMVEVRPTARQSGVS